MAAILVCSRAGENLIEGQLKKLGIGNTQILAEKLSEQLQCPLYTLGLAAPSPAAPVPRFGSQGRLEAV